MREARQKGIRGQQYTQAPERRAQQIANTVLMITHKAESFVNDVACAVAQQGWRTRYLCPYRDDLPHERLRSAGVEVRTFHCGGILGRAERISDDYIKWPRYDMVKFAWSLRRLMRQEISQGVDVIHGHWVLPSGFVGCIASRGTGIPVVVTAHGRDVCLNPSADYTVPQQGYVNWLLRFTFKRLHALAAVSNYTRNQALERGISPERVAVIYDGTNTALFKPDVAPLPLQQRFGADFILLTVRKFYRRKGIQDVIKAMPQVLKECPKVCFVIIGYGPLEQELKQLAASLNLQEHVQFLGRLPNDELPPYYAAADVFIIPSHEEAFGVVAAEAMALGKPLISTAVGGLKEVADDEVALVVPPRDPDSIANAIVTLCQSPQRREKMGQAGLRKVREVFNWDRAARRYIDLYEKVIAQK